METIPYIVKYFIGNMFLWAMNLTLPVPIPDEEKKVTEIFFLAFLCGASKDFMKAFKAFIKPVEAPQRSVKIKI